MFSFGTKFLLAASFAAVVLGIGCNAACYYNTYDSCSCSTCKTGSKSKSYCPSRRQCYTNSGCRTPTESSSKCSGDCIENILSTSCSPPQCYSSSSSQSCTGTKYEKNYYSYPVFKCYSGKISSWQCESYGYNSGDVCCARSSNPNPRECCQERSGHKISTPAPPPSPPSPPSGGGSGGGEPAPQPSVTGSANSSMGAGSPGSSSSSSGGGLEIPPEGVAIGVTTLVFCIVALVFAAAWQYICWRKSQGELQSTETDGAKPQPTEVQQPQELSYQPAVVSEMQPPSAAPAPAAPIGAPVIVPPPTQNDLVGQLMGQQQPQPQPQAEPPKPVIDKSAI